MNVHALGALPDAGAAQQCYPPIDYSRNNVRIAGNRSRRTIVHRVLQESEYLSWQQPWMSAKIIESAKWRIKKAQGLMEGGTYKPCSHSHAGDGKRFQC